MDEQAIGFGVPREYLHIERADGGFVVSGSRNGLQLRAVAHNPTRLAKLVRAWSETEAPQPAEASE